MSECSGSKNNEAGQLRPRRWPPSDPAEEESPLLTLPRELIDAVLLRLDAVSLATLVRTCKALSKKQRGGLGVIDSVAQLRVEQIVGCALSQRFRWAAPRGRGVEGPSSGPACGASEGARRRAPRGAWRESNCRQRPRDLRRGSGGSSRCGGCCRARMWARARRARLDLARAALQAWLRAETRSRAAY
jgi:hypothetical protein